MKNILLFLTLCITQFGFSQEHAWVYFTDKSNIEASLENPNTILSQRAIDRKALHNTPIDERDVPVNETYITNLKNQTGITVKAKSKWFNNAHVLGTVQDINALGSLDFVEAIVFADASLNSRQAQPEKESYTSKFMETAVDFEYGFTANQIEMLHADYLHENDYTGVGMLVAVLDSGFPEVNNLEAFQRLRDNNGLIGGYDFVDRTADYDAYEGHSHGTNVLSEMAAYVQDDFVGTAPDAGYYLFRTEDAATETPVEESYWVEAAERADSLGIDVINTSLGYQTYDNSNYSYTPADMDGQTAFVSRGANIAVEKGILVVASAGNSGNNENFPIIAAPGDSNAYTVGAVGPNEELVPFSSTGPTADGRVKPDGMAQGAFIYIINIDNEISLSNGTSFSSPILAGAITSFWQANPTKTNLKIIQLVRESSSLFANPNDEFGYGIPDFEMALNGLLNIKTFQQQSIKVYPNPVENILYVQQQKRQTLDLEVFDLLGKRVLSQKNCSSKIDLSHLSAGIYIAKFKAENFQKTIKIIKE
jgi:hypothetical protein